MLSSLYVYVQLFHFNGKDNYLLIVITNWNYKLDENAHFRAKFQMALRGLNCIFMYAEYVYLRSVA